jgi:outer membrane lipoprotein-sorting protein
MLRQRATLLACAMLAAATAGCGTSPTAVRKARPAPARPAPVAQPLAPTGAPAVGARQVPEVQQMLAGLRRAQAQVPGFSAMIETLDKGPGGQETNTMRVTFRKPTTLKIEMLKAQGQAQGAVIVWSGGDNVKIKPTFLPMAVEKSIHDAQTKSKNGWTIKDTEVNAIFRVMLDPATRIRALGMQQLDGRMLAGYEVQSGQSPRGASHEAIAIDPRTGLPAARMIFKGQELIYRATIKSMTVRAVGAAEVSL